MLDAGYTSPTIADHTRSGWRRQKFEWFEGRCAYCFVTLTDSIFTWDHVVPLSRGGSSASVNLVPACRNCNDAKADSDLLERLA
jgi:5-methylcytosine-specific restriction endonuclease McrA